MKATTKKAQQLIANYDNAAATSLWDCYRLPSRRKEDICDHWREVCYHLDGWGFRIPSYNSQTFTVAFQYVDRETRAHMLKYVTYANEWDINLDEA